MFEFFISVLRARRRELVTQAEFREAELVGVGGLDVPSEDQLARLLGDDETLRLLDAQLREVDALLSLAYSFRFSEGWGAKSAISPDVLFDATQVYKHFMDKGPFSEPVRKAFGEFLVDVADARNNEEINGAVLDLLEALEPLRTGSTDGLRVHNLVQDVLDRPYLLNPQLRTRGRTGTANAESYRKGPRARADGALP